MARAAARAAATAVEEKAEAVVAAVRGGGVWLAVAMGVVATVLVAIEMAMAEDSVEAEKEAVAMEAATAAG